MAVSASNRLSVHSLASVKTVRRDKSKPKDVLSSRLSVHSQQDSSRSSALVDDSWPVHPIECMRGPFQESIVEAMDPDARTRQTLDAATRRLQLLELDQPSEEDYSSRWRRKPGAKYHPLWKLIAQISFGIHLLHKEIAKSEEEVIRILQTHVDEIDGFLEDVGADFDLAMRDIDERLRLLLLPLEHGRTFSRMLRDREFRQNIIEGNDIIERICSRTRLAMDKSLEDVGKGLEATAELSRFLDRLGRDWHDRDEDMQAIYTAMRGNADGWHCAFGDIQKKGDKLKKMIRRLERIVTEVERQAGIASRRRTKAQSTLMSPTDSVAKDQSTAATAKVASTVTSSVPNSPSSSSWRASLNKPLPPDPHSQRMSKRASHKRQASGSQSQSHDPSRESRSPRLGQVETPARSPNFNDESESSRQLPKPSFTTPNHPPSPSTPGMTLETPVESAVEAARQIQLPKSPIGPAEAIPISLPVSPSEFSGAAQAPLPMSPGEDTAPTEMALPQSPSEHSVVSQIYRPPTPLDFPMSGRRTLATSPLSFSSTSKAAQVPLPSSPAEQPTPNRIPLPISPAEELAKSKNGIPISIHVDTSAPHQSAVQEAVPELGTPELNAVFHYTPRSPIEVRRNSSSIAKVSQHKKSTSQSESIPETREASSPPALTHTGTTASNSSIQFVGRRASELAPERDVQREVETGADPGSLAYPTLESNPGPGLEQVPEHDSENKTAIELDGDQQQLNAPAVRPSKLPRLNTGVPARKPIAQKSPTQLIELSAPDTAPKSEALEPVAPGEGEVGDEDQPSRAGQTFFSMDATDDDESDADEEDELLNSAQPLSESDIKTAETVILPLRVPSKKSLASKADAEARESEDASKEVVGRKASVDEDIGPMIASFADIKRFSMSSYLEQPHSINSSISDPHKSTAVERPLSRGFEAVSPANSRRTAPSNTSLSVGVMRSGSVPTSVPQAPSAVTARSSAEKSTTPPSPASPLLADSPITSPRAVAPARTGGRSPGPYKLMPDIRSPPLGENGPMSPKTALPQWPKAEPQKRFKKPSMSMFKGMLSKKHPKRMPSGGLGGHVALA